jgi:hypothetical protein
VIEYIRHMSQVADFLTIVTSLIVIWDTVLKKNININILYIFINK